MIKILLVKTFLLFSIVIVFNVNIQVLIENNLSIFNLPFIGLK